MAFPLRGDSYTDCLYPALTAAGVNVREGVFAGRWLLRNLHQVDYIHINWPSFFYGATYRSDALRGFALFLFLLTLARWRGARILWTVHNLYPHDPCVIPALNPLGRWILIRVGTRFFIHGPSALKDALREFPAMAARTTVIDHGNWIGYYANSVGRASARAKFGLRDGDFVFLFIGLCKPYKNLEELLDAFATLPDAAVLMIAGKFPDAEYQARITEAINRSPARARIRLFAQFVANEELQFFLNAADAVVAPYVEVLTSGTAMLALSFGRPVVAPARGFLRDAITTECGSLYESDDPDGLHGAMLRVMHLRFDDQRIMQAAMCHDWRNAAQSIVDSLRAP